jgi:hypothetical protein
VPLTGRDDALRPRLHPCQAGAYGFAMSSNYNGRLRAAEVLAGDGAYEVIRRRQTYEVLLDGCT